MQYVLKDKLGISLRMTPKCHPEIAGQGIKYARGYAKLRFHKNFNNAQASNLEKNVRAALSQIFLTEERMKKFAQKAQDYKLILTFSCCNRLKLLKLLQSGTRVRVRAHTNKLNK